MPSLWSNLILISKLELKEASIIFNRDHTLVQSLERYTITSTIYLEQLYIVDVVKSSQHPDLLYNQREK